MAKDRFKNSNDRDRLWKEDREASGPSYAGAVLIQHLEDISLVKEVLEHPKFLLLPGSTWIEDQLRILEAGNQSACLSKGARGSLERQRRKLRMIDRGQCQELTEEKKKAIWRKWALKRLRIEEAIERKEKNTAPFLNDPSLLPKAPPGRK